MNITINIPSCVKTIKTNLSVIGKRLYSNGGKNMFSDITVSSAEDGIFTQYVLSSMQDIEAALKQFIKRFTFGTSDVTIEIQNTRGDSDFDQRVRDMMYSYIDFNATGEYLSMLHQDLAQKYKSDSLQRMESLIMYVFYKQPPTTSSVDPITATSTSIS